MSQGLNVPDETDHQDIRSWGKFFSLKEASNLTFSDLRIEKSGKLFDPEVWYKYELFVYTS